MDFRAALRFGVQFGAMKFVRHGRSLVLMRIPGSSRAVYLRPGTTDADVFEQTFINRQYDLRPFQQNEALSRYAADEVLILDCGAYIGLSTVWFAERVPGARIYAVEPDPDNYALLVRNTRELPNVVPFNAAVWDSECRLVIDNPDAPKWLMTMRECDEERTDAVTATTIENLIEQAGNCRCIIVKLDIEGGESALFRSNTEWLGEANVVLIELHDWLFPRQHRSRNFFRALHKYDFEIVLAGENLICFQEATARSVAQSAPECV
jgi:FkbM family methyltransferase